MPITELLRKLPTIWEKSSSDEKSQLRQETAAQQERLRQTALDLLISVLSTPGIMNKEGIIDDERVLLEQIQVQLTAAASNSGKPNSLDANALSAEIDKILSDETAMTTLKQQELARRTPTAEN